MAVTYRTKFDTDKLEARLRGLADQHGMKALAGVLDHDADLPYKNGAKVRDVARWLELGTPKMPARPFMRRARAQAAPRIRAIVKAGAAAMIAGRKTAVEVLGEAAAELTNEIVAQIDRAKSWAAPLAASTVKRKGHDKPLSETHLLREAQSWEVKDRAGKRLAFGRPAR